MSGRPGARPRPWPATPNVYAVTSRGESIELVVYAEQPKGKSRRIVFVCDGPHAEAIARALQRRAAELRWKAAERAGARPGSDLNLREWVSATLDVFLAPLGVEANGEAIETLTEVIECRAREIAARKVCA